MQIGQYFKGVAKAVVKPLFKAFSSSYPGLAAGMVLAAGVRFSWLLTGMNAYHNKIFYSALNILVKKMVEAPILFNKKKEGSSTKFSFDRFYSKSLTNEKRFVMKTLGLDELEDHPLNDLFDNPNTYCSRIELMEDFWYNYGFGDGFLWFEPFDMGRDKGKPMRIHSLRRDRVEIVKSNNNIDPVSHYMYTCWNGTRIRIEKENMLHMKHWNPDELSLKGLGSDSVAAMDISLNKANNEAQGASFKNGGRGILFSSGSTGVDKDGEVVEGATVTQMEELRETIETDFAGAANNRRMYFTNGQVNAQNYGDTLAEMELVKAEDSHWKNTYTVVGVPWALSPAASSVTENSIIMAFKSLVTNTVVPELKKFDQKLKQMIQRWWPGVIPCHDLTEYNELAPDLKLMKEVYGTPTLTEDERRQIFGYDELPDGLGKAILVGSGLMKLQDILSDEFAGTPNPDQQEQDDL